MPLAFHQAESYFDHFAQYCPSQAKDAKQKTKARKPWIRFVILRNVLANLQNVILNVGLFPQLADDYANYATGFEHKLTPTVKRGCDKMIKWASDILTTPYNPMDSEAKKPKTCPRPMAVWIHNILKGDKLMKHNWLHIVWLTSLIRFDKSQGNLYLIRYSFLYNKNLD